MLYMTVGGPATGQEVSLIRAQNGNDHASKVIRLCDDGRVPPDNPFVGRPGSKAEIYTIGHRNQLGPAVNPFPGELWATEQGPNGGDSGSSLLRQEALVTLQIESERSGWSGVRRVTAPAQQSAGAK
jgi:glucose/arabinose dehydrogenase